MKTKITHRTLEWVFFEAQSDKPIYEHKAAMAQKELGYDPMGYGFYAFRSEGTSETYKANWKCATSCD